MHTSHMYNDVNIIRPQSEAVATRSQLLLKNNDIEYFREGAIVHSGNDDRGPWYLCEVKKSLLEHSPGGTVIQGRSTMFRQQN